MGQDQSGDAFGPRSRAPHGAADASPPEASIAIASWIGIISPPAEQPDWGRMSIDQVNQLDSVTGADFHKLPMHVQVYMEMSEYWSKCPMTYRWSNKLVGEKAA